LFVSNSQVIGCEDRLRNDLYCVGCGVKLNSIQSSILNISWQDKVRNERVRELTRQDQLLMKIREHRLWWWGHIQQKEDGKWANRYSTGFLRDHARSVDRASLRMTTLWKMWRIWSHMGRGPSPDDQQTRGVGLQNVLDTGWAKV